MVEPPPLPAGTTVGSFLLQELLTRDEFGIRYLATGSASGGEGVIEEFAPAEISLRDDAGQLQPRSPAHAALWEQGLHAFVQESELLARPLHPALVRVAATWRMRGTAYRLWPRLEGRTLTEVCTSMTDAPTEVWLRNLILPLLDALERLHARGWLHANVCPGQILVQPNGVLMLLDTAAVQTAIGARMPQGPTWREPGFRPPELSAPSGEPAPGPWSDLYSLAAVAMFCINAHRTAAGLSPQPPADWARRYPALAAALECALAVDPRDRPPSVASFKRHLEGRARDRIAASAVVDGHARVTTTHERNGDDTRQAPAAADPVVVAEDAIIAPTPVDREHDVALQAARSEPEFRVQVQPDRASTHWHGPVAATVVIAAGALGISMLWDRLPRGDAVPRPAASTAATLPASPSQSRQPEVETALSALPPARVPAPPQAVVPEGPMRPQAPASVDTEPAEEPAALAAPAVAPKRAAAAAAPAAVPKRSAAVAAPAAVPPRARPARTARRSAVPDNPAAVCAPRRNFSLYRCMQLQCARGRYDAHPQCVRLRQDDELPS
jgi:hypothetical protein